MTRRLRIGVVGTGIIAQVMHLHYLGELAGQFEVAAVCDLVEENARACAEPFGGPPVFTDWRELIAQPLDAVLILTSGSHAPIAIAAAQAGLHVLAEKPVCYSVAEGRAMLAAAEQAGTVLMVGYPKRYDPAFLAFQKEAAGLTGTRLLRVTTLESPFLPYVSHYPLLPPPAALPGDVAARLRAENEASVASALGEHSTEFERQIYQPVLLDTMVHEFNTVRGLLGEPDRLDYTDVRADSVTAMLRFGSVPVAIHWMDLPGITRYSMEFALFAPDRRVTLSFPSPFLRNEAATVAVEGGEPGTTRSWRTEEVFSYESGFKRELAAFWDCVVNGTAPVTSGLDAVRDIALAESVIRSHRSGLPVEAPTSLDAR